MKTNPNDPARPVTAFDKEGTITVDEDMNGLSKREMIAAMCMQGILSSHGDPILYASASQAVHAADELIQALNRTASDNV